MEAVLALALVMTAIMGLAGAKARPQGRTEVPVLGFWACGHCGMTNESAQRGCWNCRLPAELQGSTPSHIPEPNRWRCPECSLWNGILRTGCWNCGLERRDQPTTPRT